MNVLGLICCLLLVACGKEKGNVEFEAKTSDVSVSEMLMVDKSPEESHSHKEFLKQFDSTDRVTFAFDRQDLSKEDQVFLTKVADYLSVNIDLRIEIQGNCDIRGTSDYNIALGERRAHSVFLFLKSKGVPDHRMTCISFGSRVLIPGDSDEIHGKNRVGIILVK